MTKNGYVIFCCLIQCKMIYESLPSSTTPHSHMVTQMLSSAPPFSAAVHVVLPRFWWCPGAKVLAGCWRSHFQFVPKYLSFPLEGLEGARSGQQEVPHQQPNPARPMSTETAADFRSKRLPFSFCCYFTPLLVHAPWPWRGTPITAGIHGFIPGPFPRTISEYSLNTEALFGSDHKVPT